MNTHKKLSLRMRITLLAGTILILCSAILTITAAYNANHQFDQFSTATLASASVVQGEDIYLNMDAKPLPAAMLTAAKKDFNTTSIYFLAAVSVLGTLLVYWVAGRSLRPIHRLSETVNAITGDNLKRRIPDDKGHDEVGTLGRSFNIMLDRLEKSFLMQKRFSANVAHELKTPLATINAGIQVLRLDEAPSVADYEKILATTERNVARLIGVVDDLMALCYEDEDFYLSDIALSEMFEAVRAELASVLDAKRIETDISCNGISVRGNPELLYRACFNLVENAAKYNADGGKITITARAAGGARQIVIADTGSGIPEDELQNIFEPFYRVNKSRSRKTGGAGLGLSIVKTIIEKHGWDIRADSAPGQGAAFTITCPAK
ncbi:Signal transduction histidine kinase [Sporobacter termitidis DSM 10068]|uniref:histidine kinase n=1 Tax=Sporobacter termitidis DSM 10068 TaxID=1123282 RepID=A0A1M5Z940_9FIRM|nr:HAMP domain-containing sensor histidine kinase [Sporobacter termitidis]SHI20766.1 Signal transduction histidine kinase [Sporobacter termitidis DSM 10068]